MHLPFPCTRWALLLLGCVTYVTEHFVIEIMRRR